MISVTLKIFNGIDKHIETSNLTELRLLPLKYQNVIAYIVAHDTEDDFTPVETTCYDSDQEYLAALDEIASKYGSTKI